MAQAHRKLNVYWNLNSKNTTRRVQSPPHNQPTTNMKTTTITVTAINEFITVTNGDGYPILFGPYRASTAAAIAEDHADFFTAAFRFPGGIGSPSFRDMIDKLASDMGGKI